MISALSGKEPYRKTASLGPRLVCDTSRPKLVSKEQMRSWVEDLDSWDLCDQACTRL